MTMALELTIGCRVYSLVIETILTEHLCQWAQGLVLEILKVPQDAAHCAVSSLSTGRLQSSMRSDQEGRNAHLGSTDGQGGILSES